MLTACECVDEVNQELSSPDGHHKAVLFERNCGTASNNNLQVSVMAADDRVQGEGNALAVTDTIRRQRRVDELIKMSWENQRTLRIAYDSKLDVLTRKTSVAGIVIYYVPLEKADHARAQ